MFRFGRAKPDQRTQKANELRLDDLFGAYEFRTPLRALGEGKFRYIVVMWQCVSFLVASRIWRPRVMGTSSLSYFVATRLRVKSKKGK